MEQEARFASRAMLADPAAKAPAITSPVGGVVARQSAPASGGVAGGGTHFVQLISGRYVGDLEGTEVNVREDVLFVLRNLNRIWSIPNDVYAAEVARVSSHPANARLTATQISATIAALRRNEEASINDQVALALLGATLSASVSDSQANSRHDIYRLQHAARQLEHDQRRVRRRPGQRVNAGPDPVNNADIAATWLRLTRFKRPSWAARRGATAR